MKWKVIRTAITTSGIPVTLYKFYKGYMPIPAQGNYMAWAEDGSSDSYLNYDFRGNNWVVTNRHWCTPLNHWYQWLPAGVIDNPSNEFGEVAP